MRQTLHIFRKDVRQFWKEIAVVLASTALFATIGLRRVAERQYLEMVWSFSMVLLPLTWWFLISRVVHAEALVGSRPFWLTRPYSRRCLVAAKIVFVIAFINLPLIVADIVVIRGYGFKPLTMVPGLLLKQIMIAVVFLLPSGVLAVLTTGLVQVLLSVVALGVGFIVFMWWAVGAGTGVMGSPVFPFDWLRWLLCSAVAAVAGTIIVVLQYWKRKTLLSVCLALASLSGVAFLSVRTPWQWILDLQSKLSKQQIPPSEVAVRLNAELAAHAVFLKGDRVDIEVPIELISPPTLSAKVDTLGFQIEANDGTVLQFSSFFQTGNTPKLQATVPGWFYRRIKDNSLKIQGRAYVTLLSRPTLVNILPGQKQAAVPGGRCSADSSDDGRTYFLFCTSALHSDRELRTVRMQVTVDDWTEYVIPGSPYQSISYSLLPADFDLDPVRRREYIAAYRPSSWWSDHVPQPKLKAVEIMTAVPVAHLWSSFEITGPRLSELEVNMLR